MPLVTKAVAMYWLLRSCEMRSFCSISLCSYRLTSVHRLDLNLVLTPRFANG